MADDAPAGGAPGGNAAAGHDTVHAFEVPVPAHNRSRQSTWTKDMSDVHVSGTQTPMSGMNRHSRLDLNGSIDIGDYFVRIPATPCLQAYMLTDIK